MPYRISNGHDTLLPTEKSATPDPCSPYALTKLHGEQWGDYTQGYMACASSRGGSSPSVDPASAPDLAMECFRRKIEAAEPIVIHGDGNQRRDLTHFEDVDRTVELALQWPGPGSAFLNVGTGKKHSVMDMLDAATRTTVAALQISRASFTDFYTCRDPSGHPSSRRAGNAHIPYGSKERTRLAPVFSSRQGRLLT